MIKGFLKLIPTFKKKALSQIIMNENWTKLQFECAAHSKRAKVKTKLAGFYDGKHDARLLPLHQMCSLNPPKKALVAMIEANPSAVRKREHNFERLPLHIACINNASDDVILTLLSHYKQAAKGKDVAGRVPLHYACCNDVSINVIKALLEACPEATATKDHAGWLPVHVACSSGASLEVVKALLLNDVSINVIKALLEACPEATATKDHAGWLPVHVACSSGASLEVVKALILARPQTIMAKTKKGSTPLKCSKMENCHNMSKVISFLLNFESEFIKARAKSFMALNNDEKRAYVERAYNATKDVEMKQKMKVLKENYAIAETGAAKRNCYNSPVPVEKGSTYRQVNPLVDSARTSFST
eukprot:CAMPEP_0172518438 /NCGR_PEP_ID=MMETSP1066-20121228/290827_1 /TAXON_ID=671091 /ORGANISM="Coscinodiscus wailesii, Strain CCMP2513" /LENGTH=359 /DNA_ID=CAMNT_0013300841 /DNA_START=80 /DNA_END=1160 /DNA_ORIENTATION=-